MLAIFERADRRLDAHFDDVVALAQSSERVIARALRLDAKLPDVAEARGAVQTLMSNIRFITAVKPNTESERQFFLATWARKECDVLIALLARAQELSAQAKG